MSEKSNNDKKSYRKQPSFLSSLTRSSLNKSMPRQNNSESIPMNYKILGVILFVIVCIGMIIFYLNPYHILDYIQIPVILFYIFILFCVLIFIERYTRDTNVMDKNSLNEMFIRFIDFGKSYLFFIFIFTLFSVILYYIYNYFKKGTLILLNTSLPLTLGLIVLVLALFSNYSENNTLDNPILDIIKDVIMYIPCLLTDAIDYIKKDYDNTPSSVFIVFIILVVYCITFYISPMIKREMYKKDGVLLIEKPVYLNKTQLNMTSGELKDKVYETMPFYDRWVQDLLYKLYENDITIVYTQDASSTDISYTIVKPTYDAIDFVVPPDSKTRRFYENFTSLDNQDTMGLIQGYNSLSQIQKSVLSILSIQDASMTEQIKSFQDTPEVLTEYVKSVIRNEPYLLTFVEKLNLIYATGLSLRDAAILTTSDYIKPHNTESHSYRYSMSMWVYLNKIEKTSLRQVILSYGSLPSLYYDSKDSTLSLEYKDYSNNGKDKVLYKTKNVLYQRWNHILINYSYGTVDLFINNNLVGNYKNVAPKIYDDDLLTIGSKNNSNIGGICNVKYYTTPLTASKIQNIYTQFNRKDPPI